MASMHGWGGSRWAQFKVDGDEVEVCLADYKGRGHVRLCASRVCGGDASSVSPSRSRMLALPTATPTINAIVKRSHAGTGSALASLFLSLKCWTERSWCKLQSCCWPRAQ